MMALFGSRRPLCGPVRGSSILAFALALGLGAIAVTANASAADIEVILDQARLVKLPERVSTIVVGNPLIADTTVQPGGLIVITGKGYGTTNIIALDRAGAVLMERTIAVSGPRANTIVVFRGMARTSYSCAPICQPAIVPGDVPAFFDATLSQTTTRSAHAQGKPPAEKEK
jgi:Flp pilus assembly secretin CpaC